MTPEQVIQTIKDSGLRGRGGGGFPTGREMELCGRATRRIRNTSAATPTRATRARSWTVPFWKATLMSVMEAMAIAGYAIGASQGYIYVRAEYPIAVKRLEIAIDQAREYGLLGKNIFGTGFDFDIELRLGAGAFVCGEETALMTSIEGHRGEPRPRPPFPAVKGPVRQAHRAQQRGDLCQHPADHPQRAPTGSPPWAPRSPRAPRCSRWAAKSTTPAWWRFPMGTTLREIVEEIGGGIPNGKKFKAAQTGGPSGGCIPASLIDIPDRLRQPDRHRLHDGLRRPDRYG